ncbi:MAG: HDIG domain-containing protein [Treponema sp.]|nr:HDIG domain-containing protein [Treponema sp.]
MKRRTGPALATFAAFLVSLGAIIIGRGYITLGTDGGAQGFEAGMVADRDVAADRAVAYVDEEATAALRHEQEKQIPAIFTYSADQTQKITAAFAAFSSLAQELLAGKAVSAAAFSRRIEEKFPGRIAAGTLEALYEERDGSQLLQYGLAALDYLLETGIFALPPEGLEAYNQEAAELRHNYGPRTEREQVRYSQLITLDNARAALELYAADNRLPPAFLRLGPDLILPFLSENVFFSLEDTREKAAEAAAKIEPILTRIEPGTLVIRKGFVITEKDMTKLRVLGMPGSRGDPRMLAGQIIVLLLLYAFLLFMGGKRTLGRFLSPAEVYLLSALAAIYIVGAVFFQRLALNTGLPPALFLPTALVVMLPSILLGPVLGTAIALILPLIVFLAGFFEVPSYVFALTSGLVAAYALQGAQKRMDMVRAGLVIGGANCVAALAVLLILRSPLSRYPVMLFWSVFNGLASGMLVLGILPLLEHALNAVTAFRLIELSDLNAPILKRLFNAAPGTYSHSVMVANLAETACQEIGANPMLGRVGAYYHDIGKMEQPSYFVENQSAYNKHNDINPRLSATVIRSHVKLGVEKARSLGLPKAVIDIINEHHGNSVISWFYNAALKRESQVNPEDFSYPGVPPRSRESAVVMLADVTEAAVRTLKKPTAARIEKFIQELIMAKFEHDQLSHSELTFRDLETIKKAFVRVLAGHYHSRIEYPKNVKAPDAKAKPKAAAAPSAAPAPEAKGPEVQASDRTSADFQSADVLSEDEMSGEKEQSS